MTTNKEAINQYINGLRYDPNQLLNVQPDRSTSATPQRNRKPGDGKVIITTSTHRSMTKNLDEVVIMNPSTGVIFPGGLVRGDQALASGVPTPITTTRAALKLSIDLPGLENSSKLVDNPSFSSVQGAITALVGEWYRGPRQANFGHTARSYLSVTSAFSSEQAALDLGFSAKWTSGAVQSQLNVDTASTKSVVVAYYKQVFYTVTIDNPGDPADVFGDGVSLEKVQAVCDAEHPPAYVRSMDFGRILMIRMETSSSETGAKLKATLKQLTSSVELEGNISAEYRAIARNSSFTVVALGGGSEQAATFTGSDEDLKKLAAYIAQGAVLAANNPGAPVAYRTAFLKDGAIAKMGFTTDYVETESVAYPDSFVKFQHSGAYVARFFADWEVPGQAPGHYESGNQTAGWSHTIPLPGDAANVRVRAEAATSLVWSPWGEIFNEIAQMRKTYVARGTTLGRERSIESA